MSEQKPEAQADTATADAKAAAPAAEASGAKSGIGQKTALTQGRGGVLGVKAGMTQVYNEDGDSIAVTVIDLKPTVITQLKTNEKNGYQAVQVGILEKKAKSATKAEQGHVKKSGKTGFYHYEELRIPASAKMEGLAVGAVLTAEFVKPGDLVDLTSISKGKGMQGGMKRYHMSGGHKTHGASISHRSLGSIGNRADPGRCWKNLKMHGHMGNEKTTVQNVRVIRVDTENGILLVHGSVPGARSSIVTVRRAAKSMPQNTQGEW
jgi:large subunit ribosomal protein L3